MPGHRNVSVTGTVEDVFAHRFVIRTAQGRMLADMTPEGAEHVTLRVGDEVTLDGEMKPSELKVARLVRGKDRIEIAHKKPPHKGPHGPKHDHHDHDPAAALATLRAEGFEVLAPPRAKPKHFEILARRDGHVVEAHVELDGRIRKTKPADAREPKWSESIS